MTRLTPFQILIKNLEEKISPKMRKIYMTKEQAYEELKRYTGEDFGHDVKAWKEWYRHNKKRF